ncbi:MAG: hypothetical protein M3Q27_00935 [Actinomycetota bacterium]|nr:hypothetical protein [Actinomycetota bacterium]
MLITILAVLAALIGAARVGWHLAHAQRTLDRLLDLDDHTVEQQPVTDRRLAA